MQIFRLPVATPYSIPNCSALALQCGDWLCESDYLTGAISSGPNELVSTPFTYKRDWGQEGINWVRLVRKHATAETCLLPRLGSIYVVRLGFCFQACTKPTDFIYQDRTPHLIVTHFVRGSAIVCVLISLTFRMLVLGCSGTGK